MKARSFVTSMERVSSAWNDYQGSPYGVEVDFIAYGKTHLYAIEVKRAKTVYHKDVKSLQAFCDDYPEATPILLYQGKERLRIGEVICLPVDQFLKSLIPGKDIPL